MSRFALLAVIWAVGVVAAYSYLYYTDRTNTQLSEDERVDALSMLGYAAIWPVLMTLWILSTIAKGLRRFYRWFYMR